MQNVKPLLARLKANILVRKLGVDGGPGSGNFGHKGRPGLVGGSGPGGGKQYRGGRADIGYFGSRKDWLNGLSGEKQAEATKLLKAAKEQIPPTVEKTPEEYIMQDWPIEWRQKFMDLVGEARSWSDRGEKLAVENLWVDEWIGLNSIAKSLESRFGDGEKPFFAEKQLANYDFDDKIGLMSEEEKEFYLDMKAKACGLPTSGKKLSEYSRAFQNEIGLLPEPKIPESKEENKDWIMVLPKNDEEYKNIESLIENTFGFKQKDPSGNIDMNDAEWTMFHKLQLSKRGLSDKSFGEYASALKDYLAKKDELVGADYFAKIANPPPLWTPSERGVGLLKTSGVYSLKQALEEWGRVSGKELSKDGKELEEGFLSDKDIPDHVKSAYLTLKSVALGNPLTNNDVENAVHDLTTYTQSASDKNQKKEELRAYNDIKRKNAVVIEGDTFSQDINSLRTESGLYTTEEYKNIGGRVYSELKKALDDRKKEIDAIDEKLKKIDEQREKEAEEIRNNPNGYMLGDIFALSEKYSKIKYPLYQEKKAITDKSPVVELLKRVRQIGPENPKDIKTHLPGRSSVKKFVEQAYNDYPREWIERSLARGQVTTKKVGRGYYSNWDGIIAISGGYDKACYETATHELGHRFEYTVPGIVEKEREFFESRTKGEEFIPLRKLTGNNSYRADEKAKKDKFVNPYIGRDNGGNSFEVVSMGFEYAIHNPDALMGDPDYANLILGLLAVG